MYVKDIVDINNKLSVYPSIAGSCPDLDAELHRYDDLQYAGGAVLAAMGTPAKRQEAACRERRFLAGTGFPRRSPQADLGRQSHRAEGQLPGVAFYSHWRP